MQQIVLISCVKRKAPHRSRAECLYESDLFKKCLKYARSRSHSQIYVLSAKYGLLRLDEEVDPYDETLNEMPIADVMKWSNLVIEQLRNVSDLYADRFIILDSGRYRRFLLPQLLKHEVPMKGLRIGQQLQFLKENVR